MRQTLMRRAVAEFVGTSFLLAAVVGSGIMAERLAVGNLALALLANTLATGAALVALILTLAPISGAHLNPVVSLSSPLQGELSWHDFLIYSGSQMLGAILGVVVANSMFGLKAIFISKQSRSGSELMASEFVATFGLIAVIKGCGRAGSSTVATAVAAYIMAAYWFTPSTSFANPAVTIARSLSDTFTGIAPVNVPGFIVAQILGGVAAAALLKWLLSVLAEQVTRKN
ncbi:MAG TPA: MIP/aquaporin family protein [Pyrinomonadaceae bacterium]|nr:MIP/aquaporin family protein [Pyrinomonadaceae bacterium]